MDYAKESLRLHGEWKGKIEVVTRVPVENKDDLSLAYTPGVAQPCLEIQKRICERIDEAYRYFYSEIQNHSLIIMIFDYIRSFYSCQRIISETA